MTVQTAIIPVLAAPMFDAAQGRIAVDLPSGLSLAEIVKRVLPGHAPVGGHLRVALVTDKGSVIVPVEIWARVYPHAGTNVIIRYVPGKDALRSILSIVVSIGAIALGQFWGLGVAKAVGISEGLAKGLITLGASVLGNLLINALIPPAKPDDEKQNRYTINGWRNRLDPDGAIPVMMGEIRVAPPFACLPYTEIVGDDQYVRACFMLGYGQVVSEDYRIGDTSIAEYKNVDLEVREGVAGDLPLTIFPRQIVEDQVNAKLTRPLPRDELGEVIDGEPAIETPVVRTTGADASGASVIFGWPAGLFSIKKSGKVMHHAVTIKLRQRLAQAEEWSDVLTMEVLARKREAFFRQHTWDFPSRGRWQVQAIMMTDETTNMQVSQETAWVALQTIRPEYPLNLKTPMALIAVRVKATHQLNGQLDNFNCLARRICLDYDHTTDTWVERATSNPAAHFRFALQSKANARPASDAGIDLDVLKDWHNFCRLHDLKYDRVLDDPSMSLRDVLAEIAAAGRAAPRHDGRKWGVVIDRPQALPVIDHFSPRNAHGFKLSRSYIRPPHGVRVQFLDAANDHKPAERLIPWPGHVGDITEVERWEMPGKTDAAEIYREVTRRMFEALHRPDVWRLSLDKPVGVATRGDKVRVSLDTVERTQVAARVKSVEGNLVELDELVSMDLAKDYALRFRSGLTEGDTIGTSTVRLVAKHDGETNVLVLTGTGPMPTAGHLVFFGIAGQESAELIVLDVEAGEDMSTHLRLVDAAPIIDDLTDDLVIPTWSGRVGEEIDENLLQPPAPRFTSIVSGASGTDGVDGLSYLIEPGSGIIVTTMIEVDHRLTGAPGWTTITIPVAAGGGDIAGYVNGNAIELRARGISAAGTPGPHTAIVPLVVGGGDLPIPAALDSAMITVGALLGGAVAQFPTGDDVGTTQVQVYRSTSNILNRATDAVGAPLPVQPGRGYSAPIGDTTRQNLLTNGGFDSSASWTLGTGWTIGSGVATHASGSAGNLSQALAFVSGKYYRIAFTVSGISAGSVSPQFTGGTTRSGTLRNANGTYSDRLQAVTGNNTFGMLSTPALAGSIDNLVVYQETATSLAQGVHYVWLEPQNDDGVPGPVSGPFAVTIR